MNYDLYKILMNKFGILTYKEEINLKKNDNLSYQKGKEVIFYEDDFDGNKRLNRLFTKKQREQCWKKVL